MTCLSADLDRFRQAIGRRLGLHLEAASRDLLAEVLEARSGAAGTTVRAYLAQLERERGGPGELRALAERLTVGETYFFRNIQQLQVFEHVALPSRLQARAGGRPLRVLSAGCASGEEPFSLAMLAHTRLGGTARDLVELSAIDVNPAALARARRARYSRWSLRETPEEARSRWFRAQGSEFVLDDAIRKAVVFQERNLVLDDPVLWAPESYDIVFFRNVVMYFTPEQAQAVIARIEAAMAPGGFLFLGPAETLRGLSNGFNLCHSHATFYYERKGARAGVPGHGPLPRPQDACIQPPDSEERLAARAESMESISATIHGLAETARGAGGPSAAQGAVDAVTRTFRDIAGSRELLRQERFHEALDLIGSPPSGAQQSSEILLLQAALFAHSGRLADAERVCLQLLACDDLCAGAHYLLALCREGDGDAAKAIEHNESAAYLDPGFAMPRLHLGLIARRRRDHPTARREFGQAIALLQREDPARLLLFGGGFERNALIAVCRAELARCGEQP